MMSVMDKIARVIDAAGGVSALAALLGVKPPTVSQWKAGVRPVPPRHAIAIGKMWPDITTAAELCPKVFGPAPTKEAGYAPPQPVAPEDEAAQLQREFIAAVKRLEAIQKRMARNGLQVAA